MCGTRQSDLAGWDFSERHLAGIKQNGRNAIALVSWSLQSVFIKETLRQVWTACRNRNGLLAHMANVHVVSARVVEVLILLNMLYNTDSYLRFKNIFIGKLVFSSRKLAPVHARRRTAFQRSGLRVIKYFSVYLQRSFSSKKARCHKLKLNFISYLYCKCHTYLVV